MTGSFAPPPQPPARGNPFADVFDELSKSTKPANPFELYDDTSDDGADAGVWESEPTGTRSEPRFWQPRYYASYFDITLSDFLTRLTRAIFPFKPLLGWSDADEESEGGTPVPDLYGPVWITTTLVLALSMGSKIAEFLANVFRKKETVSQGGLGGGVEFARLWRAAGVLYFYVFLFPVLLTVFQCLFARRGLRERGHGLGSGILGSVMVYGYSMAPVVVAALVATIPVETVQIGVMAGAFSVGGVVIMLNLWRDVSVEYRSLTYFVRLMAALAHAGVGAAVIFIFYVGR